MVGAQHGGRKSRVQVQVQNKCPSLCQKCRPCTAQNGSALTLVSTAMWDRPVRNILSTSKRGMSALLDGGSSRQLSCWQQAKQGPGEWVGGWVSLAAPGIYR